MHGTWNAADDLVFAYRKVFAKRGATLRISERAEEISAAHPTGPKPHT